MYKHHSFDFTDHEINQIVALLRAFMTHDLRKPVDARRLSRQVRDWATGMGYLEWRNASGKCYCWDKGARLYYPDQLRYGFFIDLIPIEAVWRVVAPMLEQSRGYGIIRNKAWETLNINPVRGWVETEPASREQAIKEIQEVLIRLQMWGYLYYQYAGSIWAISVLERAA
jgi:hypothetical protein